MLRAQFFLVLIFSSLGAGAMPVQFKIDDMLKKAEEPKPHYPAARAGWNGPEEVQKTKNSNPAYEKLLYESSPAAIRAQLRKAAWPHWSVPITIALLIFMLRMLRSTQQLTLEGAPRLRPRLLLMPKRQSLSDTTQLPTHEAA